MLTPVGSISREILVGIYPAKAWLELRPFPDNLRPGPKIGEDCRSRQRRREEAAGTKFAESVHCPGFVLTITLTVPARVKPTHPPEGNREQPYWPRALSL